MNNADESYLAGWQARNERDQALAAAWRHARLLEAQQASSALGEKFGVKRVVLFGSQARSTALPGSDVDLWVEGLRKEHYLDAIELVREFIRKAEVDLVVDEWTSPSVRERVTREGIVLYGG